MVASSAVEVLFSRSEKNVISEPIYLPFGYNLSGIIWLVVGSRSLNSNLDFVHPSITSLLLLTA